MPQTLLACSAGTRAGEGGAGRQDGPAFSAADPPAPAPQQRSGAHLALCAVHRPQVPDDSEQFYQLSMDDTNEICIAEVQVYYNDDLTEG